MENRLYRPVIQLFVALILILIFYAILQIFLKDYSEIISLILSLLAIVVLLRFSQESSSELKVSLPKFPEAITILNSLIYLIIVIIAYGALYPFAWRQMADLFSFQLLFLVLALIPLYFLASTMYRNADKIGELFSISQETATCPRCGLKNPLNHKYCARCGLPLTITIKCERCGAENRALNVYCVECGAKLTI